MEALLGPNRLSEATSKGSVIKYANERGPESGPSRLTTCPPHRNFWFWAPSGRDQGGKASHARLPLQEGSAKRSSLDVTFARGFQMGKIQLTPSGYPNLVGSANFL